MREKLWNANYVKIWTVNFLVHGTHHKAVQRIPG